MAEDHGLVANAEAAHQSSRGRQGHGRPDASSRILARFYPEGTVQTHRDLLGRWLRRYGRPLALYTDRHSIFEPQDKGHALPDARTQFGRALQELGIDLTGRMPVFPLVAISLTSRENAGK